MDNCSHDKTVEIIKTEFPRVKLINSPGNIGYGAGVNLGVKNASNEFIVILNPDTYVEKLSIEKLINPIIKSDYLITVPKALFYDGSKINTCGNIEHFTGLTFTRYLGNPIDQNNKKEVIGGLSGVCFAIKKDQYQKIGGFDESFFLYMEDAELSWRISINNYRILYIPDSIIYHDYTLEVTPKKIYNLEKGRYLILKKYYSPKNLVVFLPSLIISELLTWGYSAMKGKEGIMYKFKAFFDSRKIETVRMNYETYKLLLKLEWRIPDNQLTCNILEKFFIYIANLIFYLNYFIVIKYYKIKQKLKNFFKASFIRSIKYGYNNNW